jgi:hypothetical protein
MLYKFAHTLEKKCEDVNLGTTHSWMLPGLGRQHEIELVQVQPNGFELKFKVGCKNSVSSKRYSETARIANAYDIANAFAREFELLMHEYRFTNIDVVDWTNEINVAFVHHSSNEWVYWVSFMGVKECFPDSPLYDVLGEELIMRLHPEKAMIPHRVCSDYNGATSNAVLAIKARPQTEFTIFNRVYNPPYSNELLEPQMRELVKSRGPDSKPIRFVHKIGGDIGTLCSPGEDDARFFATSALREMFWDQLSNPDSPFTTFSIYDYDYVVCSYCAPLMTIFTDNIWLDVEQEMPYMGSVERWKFIFSYRGEFPKNTFHCLWQAIKSVPFEHRFEKIEWSEDNGIKILVWRDDIKEWLELDIINDTRRTGENTDLEKEIVALMKAELSSA